MYRVDGVFFALFRLTLYFRFVAATVRMCWCSLQLALSRPMHNTTWIHHWLWHLIAILKWLCSCSYVRICFICRFWLCNSGFYYKRYYFFLYNRYDDDDYDEHSDIPHRRRGAVALDFSLNAHTFIAGIIMMWVQQSSIYTYMYDFINITQEITIIHMAAAKFRFHSFRPRKLKKKK